MHTSCCSQQREWLFSLLNDSGLESGIMSLRSGTRESTRGGITELLLECLRELASFLVSAVTNLATKMVVLYLDNFVGLCMQSVFRRSMFKKLERGRLL